MKTSELKEIAKKNGYSYNFDELNFVIKLKRDGFLSCNEITISTRIENRLWIRSGGCTDDDDMAMMEAAIAYAKTPFGDREPEKRYIIPLPYLITTDGEQQFLTRKKETIFACRRNKELKQIWKESQLSNVPYPYRGYAVEVEE